MFRKALMGLWATCAYATFCATSAGAAAGDVVMYATDATNLRGNWSLVADATAAGAQTLSSAERGWANTVGPVASPIDSLDVTFTAPAATAYHVWLRMRATANSKYNDSVFVQFSDAVDGAGASLYRLGTTTGLAVNLAGDSTGNGLSGWGWQDRSYWLSQPTTIRFAASGVHTLRVQTREDGASIDQIVLSPVTYLTSAPGAISNDATIVPKPATSTPYTGTPAAIPGIIQAENFDNGADGVAYHDMTTGNAGNAFRQTNIDIESASAGGYDVGWIAPGEWLNYTVNVAAAGSYTAQFRVAALGQGGTFHLEMNGTNVTGATTIPNTGGWQTWQTVSKTVTLASGTQTARLVIDTASSGVVGNIDWMQFTATTLPSTPAAPNSPSVADGAVGVTVTPNLTWTSSGATSYDIAFGPSTPPPTVVSNAASNAYAPSALAADTKYFWQIVAKNSAGSTTGPVWSFTTAGTPPPPPPGTELIVATWNVQVNDGSAAHARIVIDSLAALSPQPQVLVLTEAHGTMMSTYLDELRNRTSYTWTGLFQGHCRPGALSGGSCSSIEDEGVVVLTSLPVLNSSATLLPYADSWHSARAAVRLAVDLNGTTVQAFGLHLQTGNATARYNSMAFLKTWAGGFSKPQLVAGDFNADPNQIDTAAGMSPNFVDSWSLVGSGLGLTYPTPTPTMKLDYWFADSSGKATPNWSSVVLGTGAISDHFGLHTSFTIRP